MLVRAAGNQKLQAARPLISSARPPVAPSHLQPRPRLLEAPSDSGGP